MNRNGVRYIMFRTLWQQVGSTNIMQLVNSYRVMCCGVRAHDFFACYSFQQRADSLEDGCSTTHHQHSSASLESCLPRSKMSVRGQMHRSLAVIISGLFPGGEFQDPNKCAQSGPCQQKNCLQHAAVASFAPVKLHP